jgi:hypothetical protein
MKHFNSAAPASNILCRICAGWLAARTNNINMIASTLALMDVSFRCQLIEYDKAHP